MNTPFNTGKVQIGLLYKRPLPIIQGDALRLQSALLEPRTANPLSRIGRALGTLWRLM